MLDGVAIYDNTSPGEIGDPISGAEILLLTTGADLTLEDLTLTGSVKGIVAEAADVEVTRVSIEGFRFTPYSPGGITGITIADGSLAVVDSSITDGNGTLHHHAGRHQVQRQRRLHYP